MKKRGEITVFLSLVIVCILSLCMGLLESARTAGARLYAQLAAESAVTSVMSQYNRNLWDMYHLLFLEAESDKAVAQSFQEYLDFYLEQENLYPMRMENVTAAGKQRMTDDGGMWLEDGALSYVKYRLPDVAGDLIGVVKDAEQAAKAGDFRELFTVCQDTGKKTKKLEKSRLKIEESLSEMRELLDDLMDAAGTESGGRFESAADRLGREMRVFSGLVEAYEENLQKISEHREELQEEYEEKQQISDMGVSGHMSQELLAYEQVEEAAGKQLETYRDIIPVMEENLACLNEALDLLEEERYEYGEYEIIPLGPDWDAIGDVISSIRIPGESADDKVDQEKSSMLDRLEALFQGELLDLVLPQGTEVSRQTVSLTRIPSANINEKTENSTVVQKILVNEYCFLSFDSFLERCSRKTELEKQALLYEQEYLLCGKKSDRENLAETVEKLLTVRGSMNLLCLLGSPEKRAEADTLAIAVSGGNAPVKFILSFFILTMWAFGEAVSDVKLFLNGGAVPFWKQEEEWNVDLEALLSLSFLEQMPKTDSRSEKETGSDYKDHMRILFFLMKEETRNFRMMDLIQWNVRSVQEDFSVNDCICKVEISTTMLEKHLFFGGDTYRRTVRVEREY